MGSATARIAIKNLTIKKTIIGVAESTNPTGAAKCGGAAVRERKNTPGVNSPNTRLKKKTICLIQTPRLKT